MYCLIQLYVPIADILKPHSPLLKFLAIKSVVFLTFWQATALSLLTVFGFVKDVGPYKTSLYLLPDKVGICIDALHDC